MNHSACRTVFILLLPLLCLVRPTLAAEAPGEFWSEMELPGSRELRVLTPVLLELNLVQTKAPDPARLENWDFVAADGSARLPDPTQFVVTVGNRPPVRVVAVGFRRRTTYAPLGGRDLRIGSSLYLQLETPVGPGESVRVENPDGKLWPANWMWTAEAAPLRLSPAIHVNQAGYDPALPKLALVGSYLGSLGELAVPEDAGFQLVEAASGTIVHRGALRPRPDHGFPFRSYQRVIEADFSGFRTPGTYRLSVPGLGASAPFTIGDGLAANYARTFALGLYHLRCGADNALPFTRFVHDACHLAPAAVPATQPENPFTWQEIGNETKNGNPDNPAQLAPRLVSPETQLFPFVKRGPVDVSGGHHDAGDYSKYTVNSAALVHTLIFAADSLAGAGALDNLGLPESGDGIGDLLQEAKEEADFLAKMQDDDGGFYFLVYPQTRAYETDVLPEHGDAQVVWPKNTAATAAAVAALAQTASSPAFRKAFPAAAARYLEQARHGWQFLEAAIARHGKAGAYQKITHYGDNFTHDDELAWAATEMYLATGESAYQETLLTWFDPSSPATWRWTWWHLSESYGNAIRSYAFAARSGRLRAAQLDPGFLARCEAEIATAARDNLRWAEESAYGTSFPQPTKQVRGGGWYFSTDAAFDLVVALQLDPPSLRPLRERLLAALLSNFNYATGANPVNVSYITGLGWNRPREIVSQYAANDRRALPPDGLLVGNIQANYGWVNLYKAELGGLSFPSDGDPTAPYAIYDRWSDAFNVTTESVVTNQARALAAAAWLMARSPLKSQPWALRAGTAPARLTFSPASGETSDGRTTVSLVLDPNLAVLRGIVGAGTHLLWETAGRPPVMADALVLQDAPAGSAPTPTRQVRDNPTQPGAQPRWVEAELQAGDGRRVFATAEIAGSAAKSAPEKQDAAHVRE